MTERRAGYNDAQIDCHCGEKAFRLAVYPEQSTITATGAVYGARDRQRRDHMGEKLNRLQKSSLETAKAGGKQSGPFKLPESKTYGPK